MDKEQMTTPTEPDPLDALIGSAPGHPQWSSTDAGDIPRLLTEIDTLRQALADKDAAAWQMVAAYADLKVEADILARAVKDRDAEIERLRAAIEQKMDIIQARNLELATLKTAAHAVLEGDADGMERLRAAVEGANT